MTSSAEYLEREVKFLVQRDQLEVPEAAEAKVLRQVYLLSGAGTIRIRHWPDDPAEAQAKVPGSGSYELTIKFSRQGDECREYNLDLPDQGPELYKDALREGFPEIHKTRVFLPTEDPTLTFELDLFHGDHSYLTLLELEYPGPERPQLLQQRPAWYRGPWGIDVSEHPAFRNSRLVAMTEAERDSTRELFKALLAQAS